LRGANTLVAKRDAAGFICVLTLLLSAQSDSGQIEKIDVSHRNGVYTVDMDVIIDADFTKVFALVTDFAQTYRLNSSIVTNELEEDAKNDRWKRHLTIETCVLLYCFEVEQTEWINIDDNVITTTIIPEESNLGPSTSTWELTDVGAARTRLRYISDKKPEFWIPPLIGPWLVKNKLRTEVLRTVENIEAIAQSQQQNIDDGEHVQPAAD
jgi:hypothetical protein